MNKIQLAVEKLKAGEIIAVPTETVYGLAVDATNSLAVKKLYALKNQPTDKPTSIAIAQPEDIKHYVTQLSVDAQKLIAAFWPGPLTLILPSATTPIGIRCSSCSMLRQTIELLGHAICLTSCNIHGQRDAISAQQAHDYFGRDFFVLENDRDVCGVASTIVNLSVTPYWVQRVGTISAEEIRTLLNKPLSIYP